MKNKAFIAFALALILGGSSGCTSELEDQIAGLESDNASLQSQLDNMEKIMDEQELTIDDLKDQVQESNRIIKTVLEDNALLNDQEMMNPLNHFTESGFDGEIIYRADSRVFAYIDYTGFEVVGNIFIGHVESGQLEQVTNYVTNGSDPAVKKIMWTSSGRLLAIVGYAYGTISQGGSVYDVNRETGEMTLLFQPGEGLEIIDLVESNHGTRLTLVGIRFDENYMDYESFSLDYDLDEVEGIMDGGSHIQID